MPPSLGQKLKTLRVERGLTLAEASRRAGVRRHTIADIENGKRHPYAPTLQKIAAAYEISIPELLEYDEPTTGEGEPGMPGRPDAIDLLEKGQIHGWLEVYANHMSRDAFKVWVKDLGEDISETGLPVGLQRGVNELYKTRDEIKNLLRTPKVQKEIFPDVGEEDPTRAYLKRARLAWKLQQEIYNEYQARVVALANYSKQLAAAGITKNALVREGEEEAVWRALTPEERQRVRESLQSPNTADVEEEAGV